MKSNKIYHIDQLRGAFVAGKLSAEKNYIPTEEDDIIGKYFCNFKYTGKINCIYGRIVKKIDNYSYFSEVYEMNHSYLYNRVFRIDEISGCFFFKDKEHLEFILKKYKKSVVKKEYVKTCRFCGKDFSHLLTDHHNKYFNCGFCDSLCQGRYFYKKSKGKK
jgi:hypothetical protein